MKMKSLSKLLIEGVLIFVSVLCAAAVDNWRESRSERENYINTLMVFRNTLDDQVKRFRNSYDTISGNVVATGELPVLIKIYQDLINNDEVLNDDEPTNDYKALAYFLQRIDFLDSRIKSNVLNQLNYYPEYVFKDSLTDIIDKYNGIVESEIKAFDTWNEVRNEASAVVQGQCDLKILFGLVRGTTAVKFPYTCLNQENLLKFKNLNFQLSLNTLAIIDDHQNNARTLIECVEKLDEKLTTIYNVDKETIGRPGIKEK